MYLEYVEPSLIFYMLFRNDLQQKLFVEEAAQVFRIFSAIETPTNWPKEVDCFLASKSSGPNLLCHSNRPKISRGGGNRARKKSSPHSSWAREHYRALPDNYAFSSLTQIISYEYTRSERERHLRSDGHVQ